MSEVKRRPEVDYYKVLQVDPSAEPEVVEAAYRALSKKYHPDLNRNPEAEKRMSQINTAYDVLGDASKRRDYNQIRDSLNRYNRPATGPAPSASPASPPPATTSQPPRPTAPGPHYSQNPRAQRAQAAENISHTYSTAYKRANGAADGKGGSLDEDLPKPGKGRSNYFIEQDAAENEGGFNVFPWIATIVGILIIVVVAVVLSEIFFGNPFNTNFVVSSKTPSITRSTQPAVSGVSSNQPTNTPIPTGVLSREGALAFLQTPDMFDRRVLDLNVSGPDGNSRPDTLRLTVKLSEKGGATNSETFATSTKPDSLDTLRQSEATTYALVYSLYRQYPELNRLTINLTDPRDEKRIVYKADMTRSTALSFYPWRGDMNPATMSLTDLIQAATEDRLASHYGAPLDDQSHKQTMAPTLDNLTAELAAWMPGDGAQTRLDNNGTLYIGYLINNSEQQMKRDWGRVFYGLFTRFPNLDRIVISKGLPGTTNSEVRVCDRDLFNRITVSGWARRLFDKAAADPKSVIDSLPNDPTLAIQSPPTTNIEVKQGGTGRAKTWEISEPSKPLTPNRIGNLTSLKGRFFQVTVKTTNQGTLKEWPDPVQLFTLVDGQGYTYHPDLIASSATYLNTNVPPYGPIEQGKSFPILLVFDIPDNANNLRLHLVENQDSSSTITVTLNLT